VDPHVQADEELDEGIVLAPGDGQVDRVQEFVGRVVERRAERVTGRMHEHVAQRRDHRLGAPSACGAIGHARRG